MSRARIYWIELAKGTGVVSVVTVHSMIPDINLCTQHLSSFTIPLFFVLAGLTYNNERHRSDLASFVRARAQQYLIPYFVLYIAMISLRHLLGPYAGTNITTDQLVFALVYGSGPPDSATHLWFLPVLFFGLLLFAVTDRVMASLSQSSRLPLLVLFPLLADSVKSLFGGALVPWHINAILISTTFMMIGNGLRMLGGLRTWKVGGNAEGILIALILASTTLILSTMNGFTDIAVDNTGRSVWIYIATGALGSMLVFVVTGYASNKDSALTRMLTRLGGYSQEVYEVHPLMFYAVPAIIVVLGGTTSMYEDMFFLFWPARLIIALTISMVLAERVISRHWLTRLVFRGSATPSTRAVTTEPKTV